MTSQTPGLHYIGTFGCEKTRSLRISSVLYLPSSHSQCRINGSFDNSKFHFRSPVKAVLMAINLILFPTATSTSPVPHSWQLLALIEAGKKEKRESVTEGFFFLLLIFTAAFAVCKCCFYLCLCL